MEGENGKILICTSFGYVKKNGGCVILFPGVEKVITEEYGILLNVVFFKCPKFGKDLCPHYKKEGGDEKKDVGDKNLTFSESCV